MNLNYGETIEFDIISTDEIWNEIYDKYKEYINKSNKKGLEIMEYHVWLSKNFYPPMKK